MNRHDLVLSLAALFKTEFSLDWVIEITGFRASEVLAVLEEEMESHTIEKTGPAQYRFNATTHTADVSRFYQKDKDYYLRRISDLLIKELPEDDQKPLIVSRHLIQLKNGWQECEWLYRAGNIYMEMFEDQKANDCFVRVLRDLSPHRGQDEDLLFIKTAIARSNNLDRANDKYGLYLESIVEALSRAKSLKDKSYIPLLQMHRAKYERFTIGLNHSIKRFDRAVAQLSQVDDREVIKAGRILQPYFLLWRGRFEAVIESYEQISPDVHRPPSGYFSILGAITVGYAYILVGQITQGLGMLDSLRSYCLDNGDQYMAAEAGHTIAMAMHLTNRTPEAVHYAEQAFKEARRSNNKLVIKTISLLLALIYYFQKNTEKFEKYSHIFFKSKVDIRSRFLLWPHWLEFCWLIEKGEITPPASISLTSEISWALGLDNAYVKGLAYRYRALLLIRKNGKEREISKAFQLSSRWLQQSGNRIEQSRTLIEQIRHYLDRGNRRRAEDLMSVIVDDLALPEVHVVPDDLRVLSTNRSLSVNTLDEIMDLVTRPKNPLPTASLLPQIIATANKITGAERGALLMVDETQPKGVALRASKNLSDGQITVPSFSASLTIIEAVIASGKGQILDEDESAPQKPSADVIRSGICVPVFEREKIIGVLYHDNRLLSNVFSQSDLKLLSFLAALARMDMARETAEKEIAQLKDKSKPVRIAHSNARLRKDLPELIGNSPELSQALERVEHVAITDTVVLITGETGVGKELIAKAVHQLSRRHQKPLIKVNCAALAPSLVESELFGHEKGAFTGADQRRIGRFELATGATLFLDEIGDFPLELQAKLLRVIQEGEFERVGGSVTLKSDARLIVATNRDLGSLTGSGRFRSDLWYRLNTFPIHVPPLRERKEDIPLLVSYFLEKFCHKLGKQIDTLSGKVMIELKHYDWPGNVRQLENQIESAVISSQGNHLSIEAPARVSAEQNKNQTLAEVERDYISRILDQTSWRIEGVGGAAQRLGLTPSTLRYRMKKHHLTRQRP